MPRYEKIGKNKDEFSELVLVDRFIYLAEGTREKGSKKWTLNERAATSLSCETAARTLESWDKRTAKLLALKFVLVSEAAPTAEKRRDEHQAVRARIVGPTSPGGKLRAEIAKTGSVTWSGKKANNAGHTLTVAVDGTALIVTTNVPSKKPKVVKSSHADTERALDAAVVELTAARAIGFGPS